MGLSYGEWHLKKTTATRSKNTRSKEERPLPEAVLERLEKKKAKLAKKLEKPKEDIRKPKEYKKRQKSYQYGMETLSAQIEETTTEMVKDLKKRIVPEELEAIFKEESLKSTKTEVGKNLRELALKAAQERAKRVTEDDTAKEVA